MYLNMIRNGTRFKLDLDYIPKRKPLQYYYPNKQPITASIYETEIGYAVMLYNNGHVSSCDINKVDSYFKKWTNDDADAIKNMLQSKAQILHDLISVNGV